MLSIAAEAPRPMLSSKSAGLLSLRVQPQQHVLPFLAPCMSIRHASGLSKGGKKSDLTPKKKKKTRPNFIRQDMKLAERFSLVDAMRYIRAFEVGRPPNGPKYDLAISLNTLKNGPVIRNRMRLPHIVSTTNRVAVICNPESRVASKALDNGATLVGEDTIFDAVKEGRIEFEQCLCHSDSAAKLSKSGVAKFLGPRGLMPSEKRGTVVQDVAKALKDMIGGTEYREKLGVIRIAIGQLRYTPEELQANIKAVMSRIKDDAATISDSIQKDIHEVVLSSTNSPGFPLSGEFRTESSVNPKELQVL